MEGKVYHVFTRGVNRQKVFYNETESKQFLFYLNRYITKYNLSLYAFALMGNHFHLLIKGGQVYDAMCETIKSYTGWFCLRHPNHGKVFEYPAHFVEKQVVKWQIDALLYILNNPIMAGMSKTHYLYKFCSYRFHTKNGSILKEIINIDTSLVKQNFKSLKSLQVALQKKLQYQRIIDGTLQSTV